MITLLMAIGGNELTIPCMAFETFENGIEFLSELTGLPLDEDIVEESKNNKTVRKLSLLVEVIQEKIGDDYIDKVYIVDREKFNKEYEKYVKDHTYKMEIEKYTIGKWFEPEKIFTYYYGGCGGIFELLLKECEFNVPLVHWDLD